MQVSKLLLVAVVCASPSSASADTSVKVFNRTGESLKIGQTSPCPEILDPIKLSGGPGGSGLLLHPNTCNATTVPSNGSKSFPLKAGLSISANCKNNGGDKPLHFEAASGPLHISGSLQSCTSGQGEGTPYIATTKVIAFDNKRRLVSDPNGWLYYYDSATQKYTTSNNGIASERFYAKDGGKGGGYTGPSDRRLKRDIRTIDDALGLILTLRGVSFQWKEQKGERRSYGFIAQEVKEVLPELVTRGPDGVHYALDYTNFVGILAQAIKELADGRVSDLEAENAELHRRLEQVEARAKSQQARLEKIEAQLGALGSDPS